MNEIPCRKRPPEPHDDNLNLKHLWRWGQGVDALLSDFKYRTENDGLVFYPDKETRDALARLSVKYPVLVRQIYESLDYADAEFSDWLTNHETDNEANWSFSRALTQICQRIENAVEVIEADGKPDDKQKWSAPATWKVWCKRFKAGDTTVRKWRREGFRMEKTPTSGYWIVHKDEPRYKAWEVRDKNRNSLSD
jgi:hypothetical protein